MLSRGSLWCWLFRLTSVIAFLSLAIALQDRTLAQITPDDTLGSESSIVTPNAQIRGLPADLIEGGASRGAALFHSFLEFNVGNGQQVYFANPVGIDNIFSRVTGSDISDILGTLGVDGGANLFLLNPNGIIFGENAKLDVRGSFVATTANSFLFDNRFEFGTNNPQAPPLLTINVTPGLQYGGNSQGNISNAAHLSVGQNLNLAGENLDLQGQLAAGGDLTLQAADTVRVRDSAIAPFIASAGGKLVMQGDASVDIFALNHPDSGFFSGGDMVLRSADTVGGDTHYWSRGNFRIEKLDGSLGDLFSPYDPIIRSLGDVSFSNYWGASLHILAGGAVDMGTVIISQPETGTVGSDFIDDRVQLSDGTEIQINGSHQPTLDIRAGVDPSQIGSPGITGFTIFVPNLTNSPTSADITVDDIIIDSVNGIVFLTNQYKPNTSLIGGDITVTGAGFLNIGGIDAIGYGGNGSAVILDSRSNIKLPGSFIYTSSDVGNAGDVKLIAHDDITLDPGTTIMSNGLLGNNITLNFQAGNNITINGEIFSLTPGVGLTAQAGNNIVANNFIYTLAGEVQLQAGSDISLTSILGSIFTEGANVFLGAGGNVSLTNKAVVDTSTFIGGNSGNILVKTGSLTLANGGQLIANTSIFGNGDAGNISVQASGAVSISGESGIFSSVNPGIVGNGGEIDIQARSLSLTGGAQLQTRLFRSGGQGSAGNIRVNATDFVDISGTSSNGFSSGLFASSERGANGSAGNVTVNTGAFRVADGALVNTLTGNSGDAGDITINANTFEAVNGGQLLTLTRHSGDAGNITINTTDSITLSGRDFNFANRFAQFGSDVVNNEGSASSLITDAATGSTGNGGNLFLNTRSLTVTDGAIMSASTFGSGGGGNLTVRNFNQASELVEVSRDSIVTALVGEGNTGNGGNLTIDTEHLLVQDESGVFTSTFGNGQAGNLTIFAPESVELFGNSILSTSVAETATGDGGNLAINTGRLVAQNSIISTSNFGSGNAGDLTVIASESVDLSSHSILSAMVNETATGDGGNLTIDTGQLVVRGSLVSTSTYGAGDGGDLIVLTADSVEVSNNSIVAANVGETATGDGGNLTINTEQLLVQDRSRISTSTLGAGEAGNLTITASDSVEVNRDSLLSTLTIATEDGGNLTIDTERLVVQDGSGVSVLTTGAGNAGNLTIRASDSVNVSQRSVVSASVQETATGDGGDLTIETGWLALRDEGFLSVATVGEGQGGKLTVTASDAVEVIGTSSIEAGTIGAQPAGDVTITTRRLFVGERGVISTSTFGAGDAGDLLVRASDSVEVGKQGRITSSVLEGTGSGGDLTIETGQLTVRDGGQIAAGTFDQGNAGTLTITTGELRVEDGAAVSVSSMGSGNPGNLQVNADSIFLDRGLLTAFTASGTGANIQLRVADNILMRNESLISARADNNGSGGNIDITADFIIAIPVENSDIIANAFEGPGGRINITAQRIFGLEYRDPLTPLSDINASSEFGIDGEVIINQPDVDPSRGLTQLPSDFGDRTTLDRSCTASSATQNSFTVTGRGGIPPSPTDPLDSNAVVSNWVSLDSDATAATNPTAVTPTSAQPRQIVEAQGWVETTDGQVILVAQSPTVTLQGNWQIPTECSAP
ncbi:MAG TPA: hypothetical protein DDZ80_17450 [Cyanobacteria bacterium UBA8803]|nr:hypothetical protein [Cyanobacteria bacterium UBA8803]